MLQAYCVGHLPPLFTPDIPYVQLTPKELGLNSQQIVIPDDSGGPGWDGRLLSEYKQLIALGDILSQCSDNEHVYIFQYRKFLSLRNSGQCAENMRYAHVAKPPLANVLFPNKAELSTLGSKLFHGPIIKVRSLAAHYGTCHRIEDFCAFCASCLQSKVLNHRSLKAFINCNYLVPAPSLGNYPVGWLRQTLEMMTYVWSDFSEHYLVLRDGYQRRVGGFLLERLNSFFLIELIRMTRKDERFMGYQIVVSDSPVVSRS